MNPPTLPELTLALRSFARDRDWEQFHAPKNLAMAMTVEAAELMEHFQWLSESASRSLPDATRDAVAEEMADVLLYLLRLADVLDIDLAAAAAAKIAKNAEKYPAARVRGRADKYDTY